MGYLYKFDGVGATEDDVRRIGAKLEELIAAGEAITIVRKRWKEALAYFHEHRLTFSKGLLETRVTADSRGEVFYVK
jgi:hypothetical protein